MVRTTCEILQFRKSKTLKFHHNFDENKLQLCEQLIDILDGISMQNQGFQFKNSLRNRTLVWKAPKGQFNNVERGWGVLGGGGEGGENVCEGFLCEK